MTVAQVKSVVCDKSAPAMPYRGLSLSVSKRGLVIQFIKGQPRLSCCLTDIKILAD
ncbi:hypothetical protein [Lacticaseibacillus paracasei]|uniref:hypothetical protein n=1 Tax=Lacticaseibacillus paracasei TaxID=1597 RepID=UPI001CDC9900|nr:hypothetical protein [Lacticaseibacillus paracasei]